MMAAAMSWEGDCVAASFTRELFCEAASGCVLENKPVQQRLGGSVCCSCSLTVSYFLFQKTDLAQEPKVSGAM